MQWHRLLVAMSFYLTQSYSRTVLSYWMALLPLPSIFFDGLSHRQSCSENRAKSFANWGDVARSRPPDAVLLFTIHVLLETHAIKWAMTYSGVVRSYSIPKSLLSACTAHELRTNNKFHALLRAARAAWSSRQQHRHQGKMKATLLTNDTDQLIAL